MRPFKRAQQVPAASLTQPRRRAVPWIPPPRRGRSLRTISPSHTASRHPDLGGGLSGAVIPSLRSLCCRRSRRCGGTQCPSRSRGGRTQNLIAPPGAACEAAPAQCARERGRGAGGRRRRIQDGGGGPAGGTGQAWAVRRAERGAAGLDGPERRRRGRGGAGGSAELAGAVSTPLIPAARGGEGGPRPVRGRRGGGGASMAP